MRQSADCIIDHSSKPLLITPVGAYENAYLKFLFAHTHPGYENRDDGYYGVLVKTQSQQHLERVATFAALASEIRLASFDWMFRQGDKENFFNETFRDESLGLVLSYSDRSEWDKDLTLIVGLILQIGVLSKASLDHLHFGMRTSGTYTVDGLGKFERNLFQGLCRLLHQVRTMSEFGSCGLIDDKDMIVLSEISSFLNSRKFPTPFAFPDISIKLDEPNLSFFLFHPRDFQSLIAVRNHSLIKEYAAKIRPIMAIRDAAERDREMVRALSQSAIRMVSAKKASNVFEVTSWVFNALQFVPVVGQIVSVSSVVADALQKWVERKAGAQSWHLIGPKMAEIAIEDYLRRKGNFG